MKIIFIIMIAILLISGGYFAWQSLEKQPTDKGFVEGSLGYPSEGIPENMEICAENIKTKEEYCTTDHIKDNKYTYGEGYKIEVPAGSYYIYATLYSWNDYKAYYSEFVVCGIEVKCSSHEPIPVEIRGDEVVDNIDPIDWYKPL